MNRARAVVMRVVMGMATIWPGTTMGMAIATSANTTNTAKALKEDNTQQGDNKT